MLRHEQLPEHAGHHAFRNGAPTSLTLLGSNPLTGSIVTHSEALYAQEQWTLGRLTLQGGLRYDYTSSYYPEQRFGGTKYHPAVFVFPEDKTGGITGFNDLNTRVSVACTTCSATARPR